MNRKLVSLVILLGLAFVIAGCGGKDAEVLDDPTATVTTPAETVPTTPVAEDPAPTEVVPSGPTAEDYARMAPQEYGIEDVFFAFDQYALSYEAMRLLEANARIMKEHSSLVYVVEGHCDERGTVEYNLALGEKRAQAVRDYLVNQGVPSSQLRLTSYGEERPFARGGNESAWALNRRAHFSRP
ncbi:MAG TPA: peptidoglycan-associated lipoprotein Pal [Candidatus Krumholzibacteria bacterium]|nr:peptidoglycan-associated lipoprotein Pal [Candidatus Krumholzibacteria bacterium]HRX50482.1 peptidoglycan-associated lipoprotein Pal [Candidatus Krumholzibacteria bacterium]